MPNLYVVATPIGNLEDISLRALRVLRESGLIAAEDTRTTRRLLQRYEVQTPLTSYHEHNKLSKLPTLLDALREKDVALVTDAGTPGISDPGDELVDAALRAGIDVVPVPGASAITAARAVAVLGGSLLGSPIADRAVEQGGHLRVGLEDDMRAKSNLAEVERARRLCEKHGRPLASVAEAAAILELPSR